MVNLLNYTIGMVLFICVVYSCNLLLSFKNTFCNLLSLVILNLSCIATFYGILGSLLAIIPVVISSTIFALLLSRKDK